MPRDAAALKLAAVVMLETVPMRDGAAPGTSAAKRTALDTALDPAEDTEITLRRILAMAAVPNVNVNSEDAAFSEEITKETAEITDTRGGVEEDPTADAAASLSPLRESTWLKFAMLGNIFVLKSNS